MVVERNAMARETVRAAGAVTAARTGRGVPRWAILVGVLIVVLLALVALRRGGLLALPRVPADLTAESAGLAHLDALATRARALESVDVTGDEALGLAAAGRAKLTSGDLAGGIADLRAAVERAPDDLVLGNAYRMAIFRLRRQVLAGGADRTTLAAHMPDEIAGEPLAFLEKLVAEHPSRETRLQLALAWVDEMLLFPALEIKAPASVESVRILSEVLAQDPWYVPALYARGLNYLHRPARLVWPEAQKAPLDAASADLARCVAAGRKVGGGSPRLVGTLAMTLGDAYAKEGRPERARSWWQIAQNACHDAELHAAVQRRFEWEDAHVLDALESELAGRMLDTEHPMTDLALMWQ
jgi:tetratricopeptide (TPR) repeat protein